MTRHRQATSALRREAGRRPPVALQPFFVPGLEEEEEGPGGGELEAQAKHESGIFGANASLANTLASMGQAHMALSAPLGPRRPGPGSEP